MRSNKTRHRRSGFVKSDLLLKSIDDADNRLMISKELEDRLDVQSLDKAHYLNASIVFPELSFIGYLKSIKINDVGCEIVTVLLMPDEAFYVLKNKESIKGISISYEDDSLELSDISKQISFEQVPESDKVEVTFAITI